MSSKVSRKNKHSSVPKSVFITNQFRKDWEKLSASGRHDLGLAKEGISLLGSSDMPLSPEWLDHPLSGKWKGYREFHAKGDLVVIYQVNKDEIRVIRIGTHSELFE